MPARGWDCGFSSLRKHPFTIYYDMASMRSINFSILATFMLLFAGWEARAGETGLSAGENFRIYPSNITQTETFITRHPGNPDILFASANTINLSSGFVSEGIYVSTDGGSNWSGSDVCSGEPVAFHRGDPGIAIDKDGRFILIRLGFSPGLYSHYSTDNGASWSAQKTVASNDQDRATLISDGNPQSSYYGRSYAAWVRFAPPFPVFFAATDDGAVNWSAPQQINNPIQRCQGGELAAGPDGKVHLTWAAVIDVSPFTEDFIGHAVSSDGGASWQVTENAFDINGIAGTFPEKANIRVNGLPRIDVDKSGGPRNGWVYIVTTQRNLAPAGSDPDIILNRSSDGGINWSNGIRVNQDALNNGKFQYFPAIHVDDGGGVNVLFYDDRNTSSDSAGVYLARSIDGGDSWTEIAVSDHHFKPQPIGGLGQGYQGDNIGLTSTNNTLWPVWMDNSSGIYQIWTAPVEIPPVGVVANPPVLPEGPALFANYPNPFNPGTEFGIRIAEFGMVNVEVYDMAGRKVATLLNRNLAPGEYQVRWDGVDAHGQPAASGVYIYRLRQGNTALTRKMVLMR